MKPFTNREEAGRLLANKLKYRNALILALPKGGVPVAQEIAQRLGLEKNILIVKKVGAPHQPELAIGAIAEDERPIWDYETIKHLGLSKAELQTLIESTKFTISHQTTMWKQFRPELRVKDKTVIVVDDGIATGLSVTAGVDYLIRHGAGKIVVAAPVCSRQAAEYLKGTVDDVVVLATPEPFVAVSKWYDDFHQIKNKEVIDFLTEHEPFKVRKTS